MRLRAARGRRVQREERRRVLLRDDRGRPRGPTANKLGRLYSLRAQPGRPDGTRRSPSSTTPTQILAAGGDIAISPDNIDASARLPHDQRGRHGREPTGDGARRVATARSGASTSQAERRASTSSSALGSPSSIRPAATAIAVGPGIWETSGIIDASRPLRPDTWLSDVAGALARRRRRRPRHVEDGQLFLLRPNDLRRGRRGRTRQSGARQGRPRSAPAERSPDTYPTAARCRYMMVAMATRVRTEPAERLLNRELSHLDFHARVLELAADESLPLLERVKFCAIFSSNLDEFFQVRVAGLLGQAESGLAMRSADGLTPQQALARIRERVLELTAQQSRLWKRELRPALAAEGIVVGGIEDSSAKELKQLERRLPARDLPRADAARGRPGPAVPVHLGPLALARGLRRRPRDGRGALRARQDPRRPAALPRDRRPRPLRPARAGHRALPPDALPRRRRSSSARCSASRATPTSRSRTTPPTCSRPSRASFASAASATSSASR